MHVRTHSYYIHQKQKCWKGILWSLAKCQYICEYFMEDIRLVLVNILSITRIRFYNHPPPKHRHLPQTKCIMCKKWSFTGRKSSFEFIFFIECLWISYSLTLQLCSYFSKIFFFFTKQKALQEKTKNKCTIFD